MEISTSGTTPAMRPAGTTGQQRPAALWRCVIEESIASATTTTFERLMVISNLILLCDESTKEVQSLFMERYSIPTRWVIGPERVRHWPDERWGLFATEA